MGPGPSGAHPRVLRAMTAPILGHLDPEFLKIMDECRVMLRQVMRTQNDVTLATPGTGTSGMEAAVMNLVEPEDATVRTRSEQYGVAGSVINAIPEVCAAPAGIFHVPLFAPWRRRFAEG